VLAPAVAIAYGSGWLFGDSKLRKTAVMAAEAYFHNGVFTYLGKLAFARQRPFVDGTDHWHFFPYSLQGHKPSATAYQSFPSGHTSGIWAIATVFAKQYRDTKWVPVLAYSAATLTGISRVTENKHWLSDVIFGAALGYGIGNFVVKRNRNTNFTLFPTYWDNSVSLTMQLEF
jgi:membrane-associated phospholipid phosphatase